MSYSNKDMCSAPAKDIAYDPLWLHSVELTGLEPGTLYRYKARITSVYVSPWAVFYGLYALAAFLWQ